MTAASLTFRQRIIRASSWTLISNLCSQSIRFAANLILARLLVPEAFGLMAVVNILMLGLALFSDIGVGQSIVQSPRGSDPDFLNTAWVAQAVRGVLIWGVALTLSIGLHIANLAGWLPAGTVYADPQLPWVIGIFSFTAILQGLESTASCLAKRNLDLQTLAHMEIASQLIASLSMLAFAWIWPSIWTLVFGGLIATGSRTAISHVIFSGPKNRWQWNWTDFRTIFGFGKWVFLSSIFSFLAVNGDRLLLGGLVGAERLGLYTIAFLMVNTLHVVLLQLMASVAFPALSQVVREDARRLEAAYYKLRLPIDAAYLISGGCLCAFGPALIGLLYDPRYADAGHMLSLLALAGFAARYQLLDHCVLALGQPRLLSLANALRLGSLYILLPVLFYRFGMEGALWAIVLHPYAALPVMFAFARRHGLLRVRRELALLPLFGVGWLLGEVGGHFVAVWMGR